MGYNEFVAIQDMPPKKKSNSRNKKSGRNTNTIELRSTNQSTTNAVPAAVLDEHKLQHLYASMLKCQMLYRIAQKIPAPQQLLAGREAVLAGALAHSRSDDYVATAQNVVLASLLRGETASMVLAQLFSQLANANEEPQATPGQLALIKTMAAARDLLGSGRVALAFCGADPTALSFQNEALALAAKHKAPVVCLIETTLSKLDADNQRGKRRKGAEQQFPVITVDGADVVAIFRVSQEALRRARHGQGPSLIQCVMPEEGSLDPLKFLEEYLRRKDLWSVEWQKGIADEFAAQLDRALLSLPNPAVT